MKQATSTGKTATQTRSISQSDSSAGQNAVAIAPPDYGLDFVDSDQVAAMPLQRSSGPLIQAKLKIGRPGDEYEREADRIAERVMSMSEPTAQRQAVKEEEEEKPFQAKPLAKHITPLVQRQVEEEEPIQAKELTGQTTEATPGLESRIGAMRGVGQPLPISTRAFFEPRFGHEFSKVRVHTDAKATEAARLVNARAFTTGRDVFFRPGRYNPASPEGKRLLAHELVHVEQQQRSCHAPNLQLTPDDGTQNWMLDSLGWVGDLFSVLGWSALALGADEESGRAALHLWHNMVGSGETLIVPRDWIMDSPIWRTGYADLKEDWVQSCIRNALVRDYHGEGEGCDYAASTREFVAIPDNSCIFPWCEEADQFYASARATFTVEGGFGWHPGESERELQIEFYDVVGLYHDYYVWEHEWDPGQHSRQERGWYTPFELAASWDEQVSAVARERLSELGEAMELPRRPQPDEALEQLLEAEAEPDWLE